MVFKRHHVGLAIATPDGHLCRVNASLCQMLGYNEEELLAKTVEDIIYPEDFVENLEQFSRILEEGTEAFVLEERFVHKDGHIIWGLLAGTLMRDPDGEPPIVVYQIRDVTEHKHIWEEALRSEKIARAILDANNDSEFLIDTKGTIIASNKAFAARFGKSVDEVIGLCVYSLLPSEVAERRKAYVEKVIRSGEPLRFEDERQGMYFDNNIYPIIDDEGEVKALAINAREITEAYKSKQELLDYQTQLRDLASRLAMAEERERRRIAKDLHDSIGQNLVLSKIRLEMLRRSVDYSLFGSIDELIELMDKAIHDTRSLTFEISSPILCDLGLKAAIEHLVENVGNQHGISSYFNDDGETKPMDDDVRIIVFRAVQELITNVVRHAHANSIKVSMWREGSFAYISVEDDGIGFDVSEYKSAMLNGECFGLFSVSAGLEYLGGCVEVESSPGHGTHVLLTVPLKD